MDKTIYLLVKYGNKILVERDYDGERTKYCLPTIPSFPEINSHIKDYAKNHYFLDVMSVWKIFVNETSVWYEAYIPHKIDNLYFKYKWITVKSALNYDFNNVDPEILSECCGSQVDKDIKLEFGIRDEKVIHISELLDNERGLACNCKCPSCEVALQARIGTGKKRPHFAHNSDGCTTHVAQQTALHMLAKEILTESNHLLLPAYTLEGSLGGSFDDDLDSETVFYLRTRFEYNPAVDFKFDKVILEKRIGDIIPDVVIWRSGSDRKLIIEIAVTHFTDENKKDKIINKNISAIEIDVSQLLDQKFDRDMLKEIIVFNKESKKWIYNTHFNDALSKLKLRNKNLSEEGRKREEIRRAKYQREKEKEEKKQFEKMERQDKSRAYLKLQLKPENYKALIENLRNDELVKEHIKKMTFHKEIGEGAFPFYMDMPVTGEIAFKCDRRIWQMSIFDMFIYNRIEDSTIRLAKIWKWITEHDKQKLINWDLTVKNSMVIGDKCYNSNLALEAIKQYLYYLHRLGFIDCAGTIYYDIDYPIVIKSLVPPNSKAAEIFLVILDSLPDISPDVDTTIEYYFKKLRHSI